MDWTAIITNTVTTSGAIAVAWLALRGKLAELGKTTKAAQATAESAEKAATKASGAAVAAAKSSSKTEQSINNRSLPASDRWDLIHDDVRKIADLQEIQSTILADQGRDIRGLQDTTQQTRQSIGQLRGDDRLGRQETEQLRKEFGEHLEQAMERDRLIRELHQKYMNRPQAD